MIRLLSITMFCCCLLLASCKKEPVISEVSVPITFGSAFTLTKGGTLPSDPSFPEEPIPSQVVGSLTMNDFKDIYTDHNGEILNEPVTFAIGDGKGQLSKIIEYPSSDADKVYVKAFAPIADATWPPIDNPNRAVFNVLDGTQDVMLTLANTLEGEGQGYRTSPRIALTFKHKLSKISFRFEAEDEPAITYWGKILKVELVDYPRNITLHLDATTDDVKDYTVLRGTEDLASSILVYDDPLGDDFSGGTDLKVGVAVPELNEHYYSAMVPPSDFGVTEDSWKFRITTTGDGTTDGKRVRLVTPAAASDLYFLKPGGYSVYTVILRSNEEIPDIKVKVTGWAPGIDGTIPV